MENEIRAAIEKVKRAERALQEARDDFSHWLRHRADGGKEIPLYDLDTKRSAVGVLVNHQSWVGEENQRRSRISTLEFQLSQAREELHSLQSKNPIGQRAALDYRDCFTPGGEHVLLLGNTRGVVEAVLGPFCQIKLDLPADLREPHHHDVRVLFTKMKCVHFLRSSGF
jgi:hypothetical protein